MNIVTGCMRVLIDTELIATCCAHVPHGRLQEGGSAACSATARPLATGEDFRMAFLVVRVRLLIDTVHCYVLCACTLWTAAGAALHCRQCCRLAPGHR
jgi:hypothetical protein